MSPYERGKQIQKCRDIINNSNSQIMLAIQCCDITTTWLRHQLRKGRTTLFKLGNASRAKIRWEYVCLPKEEGGLGLRRVKDSNDATVMKHIWNMFYRKDSLWVAWVQRIYLKQGSLWCAKIPSICSWSWRKILQLRDRIRPFIRHKVSNGVGTFLWHDLWNQLGPLLPRFGDRIIYDSSIHRNAHVEKVIGGGR